MGTNIKTEQQIFNIAKNTVSDILGLDYNQKEHLTNETNFVTELGADSLDIMEISINVQRDTQIRLSKNQDIKFDDAIRIRPTLGTIVDFLSNASKGYLFLPTPIQQDKIEQKPKEQAKKQNIVNIIDKLKSNLLDNEKK